MLDPFWTEFNFDEFLSCTLLHENQVRILACVNICFCSINRWAPKLELNPLPDTLKYAFLGDFKTFSVIISSYLDNDQEEKLLDVFSEHKEALGWTIADIKRISPSVIMHQIHLKENTKTSRELQRRFNPVLKEVVREEVMKLLDAGIIYPISDS